jgi:hypothetical protein
MTSTEPFQKMSAEGILYRHTIVKSLEVWIQKKKKEEEERKKIDRFFTLNSHHLKTHLSAPWRSYIVFPKMLRCGKH